MNFIHHIGFTVDSFAGSYSKNKSRERKGGYRSIRKMFIWYRFICNLVYQLRILQTSFLLFLGGGGGGGRGWGGGGGGGGGGGAGVALYYTVQTFLPNPQVYSFYITTNPY